MLGTPYQTKLTFLANLLTILRILLQWKLDYDKTQQQSPSVENAKKKKVHMYAQKCIYIVIFTTRH